MAPVQKWALRVESSSVPAGRENQDERGVSENEITGGWREKPGEDGVSRNFPRDIQPNGLPPRVSLQGKEGGSAAVGEL